MFLDLLGEYCAAEHLSKYECTVAAQWLRDHGRYVMPGNKQTEFLAACLREASATDEIEDGSGNKGRRRYCVKQEVEVDGEVVQKTLWPTSLI